MISRVHWCLTWVTREQVASIHLLLDSIGALDYTSAFSAADR